MATKKLSLWQRITGSSASLSCFITYNRRDGLNYAQALANALTEHGINVFIDIQSLNPGDSFVNAIEKHLQNADILILIGTPGALQSEWMLSEIEFFFERRGRIIPILFRGLVTSDSFPFFSRSILYIREDESALDTGPSKGVLESLLIVLKDLQQSFPLVGKEITTPPKQKERRPLNEGKLILIGRGEAGKTSLVKD